MDNYIYRLGSDTNILGRPPRFYRGADLHNRGCRFASLYAVTHETAYAIETTAQTAQGFKGIVWSSRLWVDFDTYEAGKEAIERLKEYDLVVYDTGGRGLHLGIARDANPSHTLPAQDKAWVSANLAGADLSLYWHLHLIRLPGTKHEKTGKPKTLILQQEGRSLQLPFLDEHLDSEVGRYREESGRERQVESGYKCTKSIFSSWEVMNLLQPTGERRQLVNLATALVRAGASKGTAEWVVSEVNQGFSPPRDQEDVDRIVEWAYNDNE